MKKHYCIAFAFLLLCINGSLARSALDTDENKNIDCIEFCKERTSSKEYNNTCNCHIECDEIPAVNKTIIKRDTQQPIVGQSNPATAHNRLIQQRARQRLHQQQQRSHHITTPTHRRRLHHGHARQHHVTPIHHPHLVGSVRERFGGEKEQGGVLKRLRERQKQSKTTEATKEGTDEKVAQKKVEEGQQQIITQPPNLVDGRK